MHFSSHALQLARSSLITTCFHLPVAQARHLDFPYASRLLASRPVLSFNPKPKPIPRQKSVYLTLMITSWVYFWYASRIRVSTAGFFFFNFVTLPHLLSSIRGFSQVWLQVTQGNKKNSVSCFGQATCCHLLSKSGDFITIEPAFLATFFSFPFALMARGLLEFCNSAKFRTIQNNGAWNL